MAYLKGLHLPYDIYKTKVRLSVQMRVKSSTDMMVGRDLHRRDGGYRHRNNEEMRNEHRDLGRTVGWRSP